MREIVPLDGGEPQTHIPVRNRGRLAFSRVNANLRDRKHYAFSSALEGSADFVDEFTLNGLLETCPSF
jgi:hypothetical protein